MRLMGFETKTTYKIVEVEALRLIHEHTDSGPIDNFMRFEPDGEATRVVIDSDWEMPGHIPGFIKNVMTKGWVERNTHQMLGCLQLFLGIVPLHVPISVTQEERC